MHDVVAAGRRRAPRGWRRRGRPSCRTARRRRRRPARRRAPRREQRQRRVVVDVRRAVRARRRSVRSGRGRCTRRGRRRPIATGSGSAARTAARAARHRPRRVGAPWPSGSFSIGDAEQDHAGDADARELAAFVDDARRRSGGNTRASSRSRAARPRLRRRTAARSVVAAKAAFRAPGAGAHRCAADVCGRWTGKLIHAAPLRLGAGVGRSPSRAPGRCASSASIVTGAPSASSAADVDGPMLATAVRPASRCREPCPSASASPAAADGEKNATAAMPPSVERRRERGKRLRPHRTVR